MSELIFLKLGGSLITDKTRPRTVRLDKLKDLTTQLAAVRNADPSLLLLLGHGSGSFGHVPAKKYGTRDGLPISSPIFFKDGGSWRGAENYWHGFNEVWHEAATLNRFVMDALREAGINAMALPPSASVTARDGQVAAWDLRPLRSALETRIMPVVYGDVVFDEVRGGTILSTEDLFMHLAREMHPARILLAGLEDGVYADFPARKHQIKRVTPKSFSEMHSSLGTAEGTDVTGGMFSKVQQMLKLAESIPGLTIRIFSGEKPGNLRDVLYGESLGTLIQFD